MTPRFDGDKYTRQDGINVEVGPFIAKINWRPGTREPWAVFVMESGLKVGSTLRHELYELSVGLSRVIQEKSAGPVEAGPFRASVTKSASGAVMGVAIESRGEVATELDPYLFDLSANVSFAMQGYI
jgi:hypothetical protein